MLQANKFALLPIVQTRTLPGPATSCVLHDSALCNVCIDNFVQADVAAKEEDQIVSMANDNHLVECAGHREVSCMDD